MLPIPSYSRSEPASLLTVRSSTLVLLAALGLIVVETFSGALRFYLDRAGLASVLYIPKAACLGLCVLHMVRLEASRLFWLAMLGLLVSAALALLHGASMGNLAFSLFSYSPLLFGLVCGEQLLRRQRQFALGVAACLALSWLGLLLDKYTAVPWKGYSYGLGDIELSANVTWAADGVDRLAGFARMSSSLAVMLALFALYLSAQVRSRLALLVLVGATLASIVLTTNKSTAAAYALTLPAMLLFQYRIVSRVMFVVLVGIGIALPVASVLHGFDPLAASGNSQGMLASFYDRLVNTWPQLIKVIDSAGWSDTGAGFGLVGSSLNAYPADALAQAKISDNTALYLWCLFGIAGVALYLSVAWLMSVLRERHDSLSLALLAILVCLVMISWTTDLPEVTLANLFIGLALAQAARRSPTSDAPNRWTLFGQRGEQP